MPNLHQVLGRVGDPELIQLFVSHVILAMLVMQLQRLASLGDRMAFVAVSIAVLACDRMAKWRSSTCTVFGVSVTNAFATIAISQPVKRRDLAQHFLKLAHQSETAPLCVMSLKFKSENTG